MLSYLFYLIPIVLTAPTRPTHTLIAETMAPPKPIGALFQFPCDYFTSKAEHLVLSGPFCRQVDEASNAHALTGPAVYGGFDETGREESQRNCHIDQISADPT
jgi:hypothetical protein